MKGKIEIVCDDQGVHLAVNVQVKGRADSAFLVHALGKALNLSTLDYLSLAMMEVDGVLDESTPYGVTIDVDGLQKQMQETSP